MLCVVWLECCGAFVVCAGRVSLRWLNGEGVLGGVPQGPFVVKVGHGLRWVVDLLNGYPGAQG